MRLVFMGTPEFAVPSLEALASHHEIFLVLTQPDRPAGRGRKLVPPPVRAQALDMGLRVIQPESANHPDVLALIQEMRPQVIAVVAYGCILKRPLLEAPTIAPVNLHASLLPRYRGVAPINRAIMEGEQVTGVTTIHMDEGIDTGPMLLQERVEIGPNETAGELSERLAKVGAKVLLRTVDELEAGVLKEIPQDDSLATYARKLKKSDGMIPWERPAPSVVNHVRGVTPWPGAVTYLEGLSIKVLDAKVAQASDLEAAGLPQGPTQDPGTVIGPASEGPIVATGRGAVVLCKVCPEGKKPMIGSAWARGKRALVGCRFTAQT